MARSSPARKAWSWYEARCGVSFRWGHQLQALLDAQDRGEIPDGQITCVIASKPGVYALERAAAHGIPGKVLERKAYPDVHAYSAAMRDLLLAEQADLVVYAGFLTILDEQVVDAFPGKMMNIHPALIPSFCGKGYYGLHVHEAVLQSGVKLTGATVHFVTADCDAGPIMPKRRCRCWREIPRRFCSGG